MMELLNLILGALIFSCGLYLGWTLREKSAVAREEVEIPFSEPKLAAPRDIEMFDPPEWEADD